MHKTIPQYFVKIKFDYIAASQDNIAASQDNIPVSYTHLTLPTRSTV